MSSGIILFAFNNEKTDYVKLANESAKKIRKWLDLPTSIVTDSVVEFDNVFDNIIYIDKPSHGSRLFADYNKRVRWFNYNRYKAYELSPYDTTILLDADYIVNSDQLLQLIDSDKSFLCHRKAFNIVNNSLDSSNYFGVFNMPMYWATVVCFKKDSIAKGIFDSMKMIQENYTHYANLFQFKVYPFRNDYALSIALNINSGHFINSTEYTIPWDLASVVPENVIEIVNDDTFEITYNVTHDKKAKALVKNRDLHVMGKSHLEKIYEY